MNEAVRSASLPGAPPWEPLVARIVYPVALAGLVAAAVLNGVTWLRVDVSGLTPAWVALFVGIFPVWTPLVLILSRHQQRRRRAQEPRPWYVGSRIPWREIFVGVSPWMLALGLAVVAYVGVNFFASIALLPGQPATDAGQYYFNDHGRQIATNLDGYLDGLRYQMRMFTGHPMIFYGIAALVTYGRRGQSVIPA